MTPHDRVVRKAQELTWDRLRSMRPTPIRHDALQRLFDQLTTHDKSCTHETRCDCGAERFKSRFRRP